MFEQSANLAGAKKKCRTCNWLVLFISLIQLDKREIVFLVFFPPVSSHWMVYPYASGWLTAMHWNWCELPCRRRCKRNERWQMLNWVLFTFTHWLRQYLQSTMRKKYWHWNGAYWLSKELRNTPWHVWPDRKRKRRIHFHQKYNSIASIFFILSRCKRIENPKFKPVYTPE